MTFLQVIFLVTAAVVLGSALMVVTTRNMVHAALWLVLALFGVAVLFVLLDAEFLAAAQVVIYIGAIAILFIFAVMLTRRVMKDTGPQTNRGWWIAALISALVFAGLAWILGTWQGFGTQALPLSPDANTVSELGEALVSPNAYVIPFELAGALLLAALVGAIVVAREKR